MRILILLLLFSTACMAQTTIESIANNCSTASLKKNLYYIASAEMEGRQMGTHGDTLAANFIATWFKDHNLTAPYQGRSYFQDITALKKNNDINLSINNQSHAEYAGWDLYPHAPVNIKDCPVLFTNFDSFADFSKNLPNMDPKGKAVLFGEKFSAQLFRSGYALVDSLEHLIKNKGAVAVVYSFLDLDKYLPSMKANDFLPNYVLPPVFERQANNNTLPEATLSRRLIRALVQADHISVDTLGNFKSERPARFFDIKSRLSIICTTTLSKVHAPNVIGIIKGSDTTKSCIVISAHHDHDGKNGKDIYYGAVDNGSGTVAMMEMAAMMQNAVKQGIRPQRTIVFASFTGEERGLLGSEWYVDHPLYTMDKTYAVIDIDMFGRVDTLHAGRKADSTNYAYILVKDSLNRGLRKALYDANEVTSKLVLDSYYENPQYAQRRATGSDQYMFYLKGVPFIRIDCGFCKDYHKPTDTPDKINYDILTKQTKLAFMTIWNLANK